MLNTLTRRTALLLAATLLGGCAWLATDSQPPPIVFVHGNGDSAAVWTTTLWRFESNGWPRDRLFAIDLPHPLARDNDDEPQAGRSSSLEQMQFLAAEVERVLKATGSRRVVLVGSSRGGLTIRHYVARGGGAGKASHVVLGGAPNHGVWADPKRQPTSEFNGSGPLLTALNNQGGAGIEITPGPKWLTIRSDRNDKFAQPDGTGVDGPALKGAENVVIAGLDHRETAFSAKAFAATYRFITGRAPTSTEAVPETSVTLDGLAGSANNLPLVGALVEVYATDPATGTRLGPALQRKTIAADGRWGPLTVTSKSTLEFVVSAPGFAFTHIYRAPFPRSSSVVDLRVERIADTDRDAPAVVALTRPRGYFGLPRDEIALDGLSPPPGIAAGVAGVSVTKVRFADAGERPVTGRFNGERIVGRTWPTAGNHVVQLELHD